jgi:hypothetical protein
VRRPGRKCLTWHALYSALREPASPGADNCCRRPGADPEDDKGVGGFRRRPVTALYIIDRARAWGGYVRLRHQARFWPDSHPA